MAELTKEQLDRYRVDRSGWSAGDWDGEGDRAQWTHAGYACLLLRHPHHGYWCGYVGVDQAHPYYGKDFTKENWDLRAHQGVNYSKACCGMICHVPEPGMPAEVWWLGFDCGHCWDIGPGEQARARALGIPPLPSMGIFAYTYRTYAYARQVTERLARQLREIAQ